MTIIFLHNLSDFAVIFSQKQHFAKQFAFRRPAEGITLTCPGRDAIILYYYFYEFRAFSALCRPFFSVPARKELFYAHAARYRRDQGRIALASAHRQCQPLPDDAFLSSHHPCARYDQLGRELYDRLCRRLHSALVQLCEHPRRPCRTRSERGVLLLLLRHPTP